MVSVVQRTNASSTNLSQVTDGKDILLLLPCLDEESLVLGKKT